MSWFDDLAAATTGYFGGIERCVAEADVKTAPMFERRQQVRSNWNPTGTYTPDQLERIVDAAFDMMKDAGQLVLDKALADAQLPSGRDQLMAAREAIFDQEAKQAEYRDAIRNARAAGVTQISAPGLKRWVLGAMEVTQAAVFVAAKVACERPWWFDALVAALEFFMEAADVIVAIAGVVYDAAKTVVKVVDKDFLKWTLYAGLAIGAWVLYRRWTT